MRSTTRGRIPSESSDAVGLIVALLVRFPEIATIVSQPGAGTVTLKFAISAQIDRATERLVRNSVTEHVRTLLELARDRPTTLSVKLERDEAMSFVRITRDARSLTREELVLLVAVLAGFFAERLVKSPTADEDGLDDDGASDDLVAYALDALRDSSQKRSLVGFREEKRVLVYFLKTRKKAKATGRS